MNDYLFKTEPYKHQKDLFYQTRESESFGFLWEMGAGKSKIIADSAGHLYGGGKITGLLIVAPNGVARNWIINEIPKHLPDHYERIMAYWASSPTKDEASNLKALQGNKSGLRILSMNVEAFATDRGKKFAMDFLCSFRSMMVIDESTTIKNHSAVRTKAILKMAIQAPYRRILTGTPVTNNPLDVFTQFYFLDPEILHCGSFYAFQSQYAIMKEMSLKDGKRFKTVVGYQRMDELQKLIAPHSHRITKEECLDLPPKIYQRRYVELSKNQIRLYDQLRKEVIAKLDGQFITAPLALTKILRLQQIVGGFWTPEEVVDDNMTYEQLMDPTYSVPELLREPVAIDEKNPRVEALIEVLSEVTSGKVIIWARFRAEISAIASAVKAKWGNVAVEYHGGVKSQDRMDAISRFQEDPTIQIFIANAQSAGMGLTLTAATTVIYYSNSFNYSDRAQSEDRAHRIGQVKPVTYIDMIAANTVDEKIIKALQEKQDYARIITGDSMKEWI
jgi:SNF2 family DNA or RNA helicase